MTTTPPRRARERPPAPVRGYTPAFPRWVIALLIAIGATWLLAAAFVIGRLTVSLPSAARVEAGGSRAEAVAEPIAPLDIPPSVGQASLPPATTDVPPWPGPAVGGPSGAAPAPDAHQVAAGDDTVAVSAYFAQMDAIAAATRSAQNPETLARKILEQTMSGDMRGIDELLGTQRSLQSRMAEVKAPPSCREHLTRSLHAISRAIALLERTRGALASQDLSALGAISSEGQAIEQEAKAVDALAAEIRRAAGLPQAP